MGADKEEQQRQNGARVEGVSGSTTETSESQWRKLVFGELKLNCDVAWRGESKRGGGGIGWVLRDFARIPKLVGGLGGEQYAATILAEAEAVGEGLEAVIGNTALDDGSRLVVESDSKGLIQMLNKETMADVSLEVYLHDIWRMTTLFQSAKFCFTPRLCNRVAHSVAAYVVKHDGRFGWDELGPEFLFNILAEDANVTIHI